jgi:hypothetical protein
MGYKIERKDPGPSYQNAAAVTPHDTNELTIYSRALYIGGAGNAVVQMVDGTQVTLTGLLVGTVYPVAVKKVLATSTTATNIVALW